jgi:hypothetical protein
MVETVRREDITLLPEYQEKFLKDLLASTGSLTETATDLPDRAVAGLSPTTQQAFDLTRGSVGIADPFIADAATTTAAGVDAFGAGLGAFGQGIGSLAGTEARFDPSQIQQFMNPFEDAVVQQAQEDARRASALLGTQLGAQAAGRGAFGGSRAAVAQTEQNRNLLDQLSRTTSDLRRSGFESAATRSQKAFEDALNRQQRGAQIFGQLGQGIGQLGQGIGRLGLQQAALGETAQQASLRDIAALGNVGRAEQAQRQAELDANFRNQMAQFQEPFTRLSFQSDIFRGVPSTQQRISTAQTPSPSTASQVAGLGLGLYGLSQTPLLGGLLGGKTP